MEKLQEKEVTSFHKEYWMFNLLEDNNFIEFVLERGNIPFVVRGSLGCIANFNFSPLIPVRISRPTYRVHSYGKNVKQKDDIIDVFINELHEEVVFPGEIDLPEGSIRGVAKSLYGLELWADLLCIAVGNPKIAIEVQRPLNPVIAMRKDMDPQSLNAWSDLFISLNELDLEKGKRTSAALWWYRKACGTAYYSIFDSYTANWNCIEILCNISGGKIRTGADVDQAVEQYIMERKQIKCGHILECYNRYVNYSIKEQIKDGLNGLINPHQAEQIVHQCFEVTPRENQLYQIRNDINHGNIRENSTRDVERVYLRGALLSNIVLMLLYSTLGRPISPNMDINDAAVFLANPPWQESGEE